MENPLIETWKIHNRIHLYLLEAIPEEAMGVTLNPKSRSVYGLFAHLHNVRLMWLKAASEDLLAGVEKLDTKRAVSREEVKAALEASGEAVTNLLARGLAEGRIKNFKPHPTAFLGYLISHESHHRGQIEWALRYAGHPLNDKTSYGLWEWGVR